MSGYRAGYSELHSPGYALGLDDGRADRELLCEDPEAEPRGPMPPDPAHPVMYYRGYEAGFQGE
jgi:hypothetical protein